MLRYTIMRLGLFFGCLLLFWLLGLRNDQVLLLLVSALVSVVLSFFLLRRQRDEFSERIAARVEQRQQARLAATRSDATTGEATRGDASEATDEEIEDAEISDARHERPTPD